MGLFSFLFGLLGSSLSNNNDDLWVENDSWFEHSGEDHDVEDGYCMECDCEIEDCEE